MPPFRPARSWFSLRPLHVLLTGGFPMQSDYVSPHAHDGP